VLVVSSETLGTPQTTTSNNCRGCYYLLNESLQDWPLLGIQRYNTASVLGVQEMHRGVRIGQLHEKEKKIACFSSFKRAGKLL
jgi:hypothetical protein